MASNKEYLPGETQVWVISSLGVEVTKGQTLDVPKHSIPYSKRNELMHRVGRDCPSRTGRTVFPNQRYTEHADYGKPPYVRCLNGDCFREWR